MSSRLSFNYSVTLDFSIPVQDHSFILRCIPQNFSGQSTEQISLKVSPGARWLWQQDSFGNFIQTGHFRAPHSTFNYTSSGIILTEPELYDAHGNTWANPVYGYTSGYTAVNEEMKDYAASFSSKDRYVLASDICQSVYDRMTYRPGITTTKTKAADVFSSPVGVCQDYSHLYIAVARTCGLLARYCNGIHVGGPASHAWCEVFLSGRWVGIDPTHNKFTDDSYIRFNTGRDFSDCPLEKGVFTGLASQVQTISVECLRLD